MSECLICTKAGTVEERVDLLRALAAKGVFCCPDCVTRLTRALRELEAYAAYLPYACYPIRGTTGRMKPGYASQAPLRLDVVAFLKRTELAPVEHDDVRSLPSTLDSLADAIAEAREEQRGGDPYAYIRSNLRWCATQDWVDELATDLLELHRTAQQFAQDRPQKPLGDCLNVTCDGKVRWGGPGRPARCGACKRQYDGLDLVRLGVNEETAA